MSGFWRRCRELLQRRRVDRESVVELEQHLALVLLCGSWLLVRSPCRRPRVRLGWRPRALHLSGLAGRRHRGPVSRLLRRAFSPARSVAWGSGGGGARTLSTSPLGPEFDLPVWPEGSPDDRDRIQVAVRMATPGYFNALRLEIAAMLLGRGARLDVFCTAMMGMLDVVRPVVDAYPGAIDWLAPTAFRCCGTRWREQQTTSLIFSGRRARRPLRMGPSGRDDASQ